MDSYRLLAWHEVRGRGRRVEAAHAERLLDRLVLGRTLDLRAASRELFAGHLPPWLSRHDLLKLIRHALRRGNLVLVVHRSESSAPIPLGSRVAESAPALAPETTDTWFEARLVDELGEPIEGVFVSLEVGGEQRLQSNADGRARIDVPSRSFGFGRVPVLRELIDALRERWDGVRDGERLEPHAHQTFLAVRQGVQPEATLRAETTHTFVFRPWVLRARLLGLYFDTNKCFLLPVARPGLRRLARVVERYPDSTLLAVGHTDVSGDPSINDPLSLERAESVVAFLRDDVDAWLTHYGAAKSAHQRWGWREDRAMLGALEDGPEGAEDPVVWFQRTRGLAVDGIAGPETRRALITEYMALDGTTVAVSTELVGHGCGESFPVSGDSTPAGKQLDRRVELFLFDRALGVQPPAPGVISGPGSVAYPEWVARAEQTIDIDTDQAGGPSIRLCDELRDPIPDAVVRYVDSELVDHANEHGWLTLHDDVVNRESCEIEWTRPGTEHETEWPFRRTVFLELTQGEQAARRRLHNVGYSIDQPLSDAVTSYELDWRDEITGQLETIEDELRGWHDGGPPPSTSQVALDGDVVDPNRIGTAVPLATSFEVWLTIEPIPNAPTPLHPRQLDIEWHSVDGHPVPTENGRAVDKQGRVVAKFVGVQAGEWSIAVVHRDAGHTAAHGAFSGNVTAPATGARKLSIQLEPLAIHATFAIAPGVTEYGFDGSGSPAYKLLVDGKTDTLKCTIDRPGSFKQVIFETIPDGVVTFTPSAPTGDTTQLQLTPVGGAIKRTTFRVRVVLPFPGSVEILAECELLVVDEERDIEIAPRIIQEPTWVAKGHSTPTPSWSSIETKLKKVFKQAAVSISFGAPSTVSVAFDKHPQDDTLGLGAIDRFEEDTQLSSKEADLIHAAAKDSSADVTLYCLNRRPNPMFASLVGVTMGIPSTGCFFFPDAIERHELTMSGSIDVGLVAAHEVAHSLGLPHDGREDSLMRPAVELVNERLYVNHWTKLNPPLEKIAPEQRIVPKAKKK